MYKTYQNTHAFGIFTVNVYKLVLICKFIDKNRQAKIFAQRTEEEIGTFYSYGRQFSLRQVGMQ